MDTPPKPANMDGHRLSQESQSARRSRLSDGSSLPPPPSQSSLEPPSILGPRVHAIDKESKQRDQELQSAVQNLSDRVSVVEERSNTGWREVVEQKMPSIEERQRDQTLQINKLRTECDGRAVDNFRAIQENAAAILDVKQRHEALSTTVRELQDEVKKQQGTRTKRLQDHEERLMSLEKMTQVEGAQKRQAEFLELSNRISKMEKDRDEERKKHKKELADVLEQVRKLATKGTQAPEVRLSSVPRPSSSASNRSMSGPLPTPRGSVQGQERPRPGKRQASPTESPSRANAVKRPKAKGPAHTPAPTDNDSDEESLMESQSRRLGQTSKPPTPARSDLQSAAHRAIPSNEQPLTKEQPTTNASSTPKAKKQVKAEPVAKVAKRTREATPEGLTKVAKDKFRYIRELKDFDCTDFPKYKSLRDDYLTATHQFPLFKLEIRNETYGFFLHTGEKNTVESCSREQVIGILKESQQTDMDRKVVKSLGVVEACKVGARGKVHEKDPTYYLLCLGEVYKSVQNSRNNKKESTGWFVFVDVAAKQKPVYLIWREWTFKDDKLVCTSIWSGAATLGLESGDRRDCFVLLSSIKDWPKDPDQNAVSDQRIKVVLDTHGQRLHAVFTRPLCEYLVQRLEEGWKKSVTFKETVRAGPVSAKD